MSKNRRLRQPRRRACTALRPPPRDRGVL